MCARRLRWGWCDTADWLVLWLPVSDAAVQWRGCVHAPSDALARPVRHALRAALVALVVCSRCIALRLRRGLRCRARLASRHEMPVRGAAVRDRCGGPSPRAGAGHLATCTALVLCAPGPPRHRRSRGVCVCVGPPLQARTRTVAPTSLPLRCPPWRCALAPCHHCDHCALGGPAPRDVAAVASVVVAPLRCRPQGGACACASRCRRRSCAGGERVYLGGGARGPVAVSVAAAALACPPRRAGCPPPHRASQRVAKAARPQRSVAARAVSRRAARGRSYSDDQEPDGCVLVSLRRCCLHVPRSVVAPPSQSPLRRRVPR
jgi:hypothetical protein